MDPVWQDLKAAWRALRARPALAAAAVLTLGLAIGANAAVFSVVQAVLLRQLPYRDAGAVVGVWADRKDGGRDTLSIPDYVDLEATARSLDLTAYTTEGVNLTGGDLPERVQWVRTSGGFWEVLGVQPALGRPFTAAECESGAHVALLTDGLWRRRFGGDPSALGRSVVLDEESYEVVGVLPPGFVFPGERAPSVAVPFALATDPRAVHREEAFLRLIGRLHPGVTPAAAAAELTQIARALDERHAPGSHRRGMLVRPVADEVVGAWRELLSLLLAAVGAVLLVGCANLASLLLAAGLARRHERSVRAALGAGGARLLRQALFEGLLLAAAGGALGAFLGVQGTSLLISLSPRQIPRMAEAGMDGAVLAFLVAVSVAAGIACALLPALEAARVDPAAGLGDARSSAAPRSLRTRAGLVAAEVALCLTLLALAGLLLRSFALLSEARTGISPEGALTLRLSLPARRYPDAAAAGRFVEALRTRLLALPGAVAAGTVNALPLSGLLATNDFYVAGSQPPRGEVPEAYYRMTSPGYFAAMGIPLLEGRDLADTDGADAPSVAVVNQTLARRFFPGRSALGGRLRVDGDAPWRLVEIVGVVGDVAHDGPAAPPTLDLYVPLAQTPANYRMYALNFFVAVRLRSDVQGARRGVVEAVRAQDGLVPVAELQPMEQVVAAATAPRRFNLVLIEAFAAAALVLAALGIYSLTAFNLVQRKRELAIRLALGARPAALVRLAIGGALRPVLAGLVLGLGGALAAGRLAAGLLVGVRSTDPATIAGAVAALGGAALLAAWWPSRRAARVDPLLALRD